MLMCGATQIHAQVEDILDSLANESADISDRRAPQKQPVTQASEEQIDSLLNIFFKETQVIPTVKDCEPTKSNPFFPDSVYAERLRDMRTVIEMPYNDIVRSYIDKYCNKMRLSMSAMLGASNFYFPTFETALESEQLPDELKYLPIIESALKPEATSPVGAAGLWQFMPATGKGLGLEINSLIDERRDLEKSSYAAAALLKKMYGIYHDWSLVIAAYNCGPGNVNKAIKRAGGGKNFWDIYNYLPRETRGYFPSFVAATYVMTYYCEHGICPVEAKLPENTDTVMISSKMYFNQIAAATGASIEMIKKLNPQYRSNVIPGTRSNPCSLRLPEDRLYRFIQKLEKQTGRKPGTRLINGNTSADAYGGTNGDTLQDSNNIEQTVLPSTLPDNSSAGTTPKETDTPKPGETYDNSKTPAKKVPVSK